jgi:hypothetical protein
MDKIINEQGWSRDYLRKVLDNADDLISYIDGKGMANMPRIEIDAVDDLLRGALANVKANWAKAVEEDENEMAGRTFHYKHVFVPSSNGGHIEWDVANDEGQSIKDQLIEDNSILTARSEDQLVSEISRFLEGNAACLINDTKNN